MGRKGGAKGKAHSSGLVDDVDAADRAKKSDTAVFGRPKKPKKGRNRYESSSDEDTAPLTAANKPATKVPEEVDSALEITQTRSQKRKQKKDRKNREKYIFFGMVTLLVIIIIILMVNK